MRVNTCYYRYVETVSLVNKIPDLKGVMSILDLFWKIWSIGFVHLSIFHFCTNVYFYVLKNFIFYIVRKFKSKLELCYVPRFSLHLCLLVSLVNHVVGLLTLENDEKQWRSPISIRDPILLYSITLILETYFAPNIFYCVNLLFRSRIQSRFFSSRFLE